MSETTSTDFLRLFEAGVASFQAGDFRGAEEAFAAAMSLNPTVNAAANLARACKELGQFDRALVLFRQAAEARPGDPKLWRELGLLHLVVGQLDAAQAAYERGLAAAPGDAETSFYLGALHLAAGRFSQGWPLYEQRLQVWPRDTAGPVGLSCPQWMGEPLSGRSVLVWREQGLGDQLLFARYVSRLKAQGAARVTVVCHPALARLFERLEGADAVVANADRMSLPRHDYWVRFGSIPARLGDGPPPTGAYIRPPDGPAPDPPGRIGLVWRGNPNNPIDRHRSLPADQARRLLNEGLVSLHPEDTGAKNFADTAALIARLDLVVSIDTSVAHLAGAMGKPCWALLPVLGTDWRWPPSGETVAPWYPATRVWRQARHGDWAGVVDQVLEALQGWA